MDVGARLDVLLTAASATRMATYVDRVANASTARTPRKASQIITISLAIAIMNAVLLNYR